ncbi:MAG: histidinol dehydrogenase [Deltaproteobacteria bacterium]|nr:histidinol dehydrogenase [Deltaproteobacteria bacterium]
MTIDIVKTTDAGFRKKLDRILRRRGEIEKDVEARVAEIIDNVRRHGDKALVRYAKAFDGVALKASGLEVSADEMERACEEVSKEDLRALRLAAARIRRFHRRQIEKSWSYRDSLGLELGQRIRPVERAGAYVPGGKAAYPSTVLMTVIPAVTAGVPEVAVTTPVREEAALVLAAARVAGAHRVFRVGGAQAVAALAYGTETIPRVDKIVGPGNVYVAAAKRLVFGQVDIDSIAGPSEVLLLVDGSADPRYVAADMLSQAEHDELAAAVCVTPSMATARKVQAAIEEQLKSTRRQAITLGALRRFGTIMVTRSLKEAVEITNAIAPEHVQIMVREPDKYVDAVRNAGAIFIGAHATPALSDYVAGPNHVLPTGGSARFFSPLGAYDFLKRTSIVRAEARGLKALAPAVIHLARREGLDEHARAVEARLADR